VNNSVIAIGAFNCGVKSKKRIDQTIKSGMALAGSILAMEIVIMQTLTVPILRLFDASHELMEIGSAALRIISLGYLLVALTLIMQGVYQALGNGLYSLIVTLMRVAIVLIPALYIFAKIFPLEKVWWTFVLAEGFSAVVGAFLLKCIYHKKVRPLKDVSGGGTYETT
jgi:Na+-driven multidrug efflux pump